MLSWGSAPERASRGFVMAFITQCLMSGCLLLPPALHNEITALVLVARGATSGEGKESFLLQVPVPAAGKVGMGWDFSAVACELQKGQLQHQPVGSGMAAGTRLQSRHPSSSFVVAVSATGITAGAEAETMAREEAEDEPAGWSQVINAAPVARLQNACGFSGDLGLES